MITFLKKFAKSISGSLSGFDRLILRGNYRSLNYVKGMKSFLYQNKVLLKDFGKFCEKSSSSIKAAGEITAQKMKRPIQYMQSSHLSKEMTAKQIATKDKIENGLIAVLTAVEPCRSYDIFKNRQTHRLELVSRNRKCLFQYFYLMHPLFGFCHVRIQTWFPFEIQVYLNGREWLAKELDKNKIKYTKKDNCFSKLGDCKAAQVLFDKQLDFDWTKSLTKLTNFLNPGISKVLGSLDIDPYWCVHQSEWATDVMFESKEALDVIYPKFIVHGFKTMNSPDVMRFLHGKELHGNYSGEIVSDVKERIEGVRIKHRAGKNSIKAYNKQGSVFRVETTINDTSVFKVFRTKQDASEDAKPDWYPLRKGVADIKRRSEVSQSANNRYLDHLAQVEQEKSVDEIIAGVSKSLVHDGKTFRGLNVWSENDQRLLAAIADGKHAINGFRNRDIRQLIFGQFPKNKNEEKKQSAKVSRLLKILRVHGIIKKVPRTHRYQLTDKGRLLVTLLGSLKGIETKKIVALAA